MNLKNILNEVSKTSPFLEATKINYDKLSAEQIYGKGRLNSYFANKDRSIFDFKKGFDKLIEKDKTGKYIVDAGAYWKEFDYDKALDALIEKDETGINIYEAGNLWKQFDFKRGLDALIQVDKTGGYIYYAGRDWKEFDFEKGISHLKKISPDEFYLSAKISWPPSGKDVIDRTADELKKAPHRKDRTLKLEATKIDYKNLSAKDIYSEGRDRYEFDFKKGFDALLENDDSGLFIYFAGRDWKQFDFKKGFDALLEKDTVGAYITAAGYDWKKFDFKKGLDALIKISKDGYWVYHAGKKWKQFDYKKGLAHLKKISPNIYYKFAKDEWPLTGKEVLDKAADELKKAPHRKDRTLKLEATEANYKNLSAKDIYSKGLHASDFDYEKGLGALLEKDTVGEYITAAGRDWKQFNHEKALDALIQKDKTGEWIFDAGAWWKQFNYKKGFDALLEKDKVGNFVHRAGKIWKQFDYEKGYNHLKKVSPEKFYKFAKRDWPMSGKETLDKISNKLKDTPHRKDKKLKLEATQADYDKLSAKEIYEKGKTDSDFDFDKGLDALIEQDKNGEWIYLAGLDWKEFDYKKALDALIQVDKTGGYIYNAGRFWKQFDFDKGLDGLIKNDSMSYIYFAGMEPEWKQFNYKKAINYLKKVSPNGYYLKAKRDWKLTGRRALDLVATELKDVPHRKDKKLKL